MVDRRSGLFFVRGQEVDELIAVVGSAAAMVPSIAVRAPDPGCGALQLDDYLGLNLD